MEELPIIYPVDLKDRVFAAEGPITLMGVQINDIPNANGKYFIGSISDRVLPEVEFGDILAPVIPIERINTWRGLEQIEQIYPIVTLYAAKGSSPHEKLRFYRYDTQIPGSGQRDFWQIHPGRVIQTTKNSFFPGRTWDHMTRGKLQRAAEEFKGRYRTFTSVLE